MTELSAESLEGISFYNRNPATFLATQAHRDAAPAAIRLAQKLPRNCLVVDAGCGAGVEAAYFLTCGFRLYAYDASAEMSRAAQQRLQGRPISVETHAHHELQLPEPADAIYAGASLLFLSEEDLRAALQVFRQNLAPNGILSVSFKEGQGSRKVEDGRVFHDRNLEDAPLLAVTAGLALLDARVDPDVLGRGHGWVCFEFVAN